jgi:hypothetical protein
LIDEQLLVAIQGGQSWEDAYKYWLAPGEVPSILASGQRRTFVVDRRAAGRSRRELHPSRERSEGELPL